MAGLVATMMPLLASDDLSIRAAADTTATAVTQDGDNAAKSTLATCATRCDGNPRGGREAVIEFAVTTVPSAAVNIRATLRVHAWQQFAATVTAHASPLSARESRPPLAAAGAALDSINQVSKGFNEWDISKLVTGNGNWTVSLAQSGLESRIYWASVDNRNADLRPSLVISYDLGTPPTVTPTRPAPPPVPSASPTTAAPRPTPTVAPTRTPTPSASGTLPAASAGRCRTSSSRPAAPGGACTHPPGRAGLGPRQGGRRRGGAGRAQVRHRAPLPRLLQRGQQRRLPRRVRVAADARGSADVLRLGVPGLLRRHHPQVVGHLQRSAGQDHRRGRGPDPRRRHPVFMGFDHEPEDEPAKGSDADFVRAWRYIHGRFANAGATNAVWVWTMMGWSGHYSRYADLYPGDQYVDWVAYDPYNFHVCNGSTVWKSPSTTVSGFYRWLDDNGIGAGKPRMLAEFGTNFNSEDRGAKQRWFEEFPAALKAHPKIKAAIYFNSAGMTSRTATCDMTMNHDASAVAGFAQAGRDSYLRQPTGGSR
ncbi:glycoside hydrolase [Micromonospora sp. M12]